MRTCRQLLASACIAAAPAVLHSLHVDPAPSRPRSTIIGCRHRCSRVGLALPLACKPYHAHLQVFESGSLYSPSVLDITEDDLLAKAKSAIANITAVSLATSYPTQVRRSGVLLCLRDSPPCTFQPPQTAFHPFCHLPRL